MNETTRDNPDRVTVSTFSGLTLQAAGLGWLAAVVRPGVSYATPAAFIDGFRPAEWVAAAVAAVGVPIAALAPSKSAAEETGRGLTPVTD